MKAVQRLTASSGGGRQSYLDGLAREHATIGCSGSPQGLASVFAMLCSGRASSSVGSTYAVDGGMVRGP